VLDCHGVEFVIVGNKRAAGRPKDLADIDALQPGSDDSKPVTDHKR
jgi:hypothetical protein